MLLERVEGDARAERVAAAMNGAEGAVEDARVRLDELLLAVPKADDLTREQRDLRRALGVR